MFMSGRTQYPLLNNYPRESFSVSMKDVCKNVH